METQKIFRLGAKIRLVRKIKGYSQEYVAMRLGVSQNAFSKMERGFIRIKPMRFKQISEVLEIEPYNLSKVNDIMFSGQELTDIRLSFLH